MNQQSNQPPSEVITPEGTQHVVVAQMHDDLIRRALANIPKGSVNIFDNNLRYLFAAGRGWDELGIRPESLRGKTLEELYPQEIVDYIAPHYQQALKGQEVTFDLLLRQRWYTVHAAPILDTEGSVEAIVAVAQESSDRKQDEAALEKTNREILSIWESMTDAFFALDPQWCFTHINVQAERILQRRREDLIGKNVWSEFPDAIDDIFYTQYHLAVVQQKAVHFEAFYPALEVWVDVHAYPSSAGLAIYFHDITQRIRGEEIQRRLATIVESVNDAILSTDPNFVITSWNRAATKLFGFSPEEVIGRPLSIFWPPERSNEAAALLLKVLGGENIQCFETERIHRDGRRLHVSLTLSPLLDAVGRTIGVSGVIRDIGEFKRAAEAQARLAAIVESSGDAISSFDVDGIVTSWNRGAEYLYGYTSTEMVGQSIAILTPPHLPQEVPGILSRLKRGESIRNFETQRRCKNGSMADISLTISPLFDATGRLIGSSAITRDISQRKQAEEALRRSENLYRTLVQHFPNGSVYLLDRDARVLVAEGRGLSTVGLSKEKLLGKLPKEIFSAPELWQKLEAEHQRALQGEESTCEVQYQGRSRLIQLVPVPDENGEICSVLAMTQDITERKHAEEALRQSEARLARAQKVAHLGYMELSPGTGEDFWSDETYRILGLEPGSIEPKFENFAEFVHEEDLELAKQSAQNLFSHHQSFEVEQRIVRRNGEVRWIQAQADILGDGDDRTGVSRFVCTLLDITERKQAEEAQVRLAAIVESSDDAILSKTLDGIVTTWNRGAEQMYGYSAQEAIGRHMRMLLPLDRGGEEEEILEKLRRGEPLQNLETRRQRKDGQIIDVSISSSPLLNSTGSIIGASSIARDITAQKASQAEQVQLNLELEHQRRRLDEILAHVPGIVWENDINPQTFQQSVNYVSNYVEQMLGYTQDEWLHSPSLWLSAVHPEDRERVLAQSQAIIWEGNESVLQYRFITREGHVIWTETHCAVVRDEHDTVVGLRGVTMDITERMRAQEEQSRLAALLESTTDFVGWADMGGRVQYINPAGRAMLGLSPDEQVEGTHISEFAPPWTYDTLVNTAYPVASRDGSWSGETAFLSRDGREIPVSRVLTAHKDATGDII